MGLIYDLLTVNQTIKRLFLFGGHDWWDFAGLSSACPEQCHPELVEGSKSSVRLSLSKPARPWQGVATTCTSSLILTAPVGRRGYPPACQSIYNEVIANGFFRISLVPWSYQRRTMFDPWAGRCALTTTLVRRWYERGTGVVGIRYLQKPVNIRPASALP